MKQAVAILLFPSRYQSDKIQSKVCPRVAITRIALRLRSSGPNEPFCDGSAAVSRAPYVTEVEVQTDRECQPNVRMRLSMELVITLRIDAYLILE